MANPSPGAARFGATLLVLVAAGCSEAGSSGNAPGEGGTDPGAGGNASGASGGTANSGSGGSHAGGAANGGSAGSVTGGRTGGAGQNGSGGATSSGGSVNGNGGTAGTGGSGAGGASGSGGSDGGGSSGAASDCKRGIAANTAPGSAFFPAITWWYNWAIQGSGAKVGIEFTPMIWGATNVNGTLPVGSKYLLTFNEPNFHAQSNLTAAQAASYWPTIEAKAAAAKVPIVGPGMNFCGPAASCNGTSPYQYLKDFFAACPGCKVDYVAVHWYNCDLPSLKDYLEPGGNLEGFEQFGKPIWLTEFSCNGSASVAEQEAFMRAAIPYLEGNPHVFRYSWFSAGPIPNARLINTDGSPTALGNVYIGLGQSCQ
jgi:hypothetical protein